ncbi:hypothetical protein PVAP13_4NG092800 [Panicum virgatum]|uniref:Uncharacterized protein n=1 Tax=Panicum virgatum TaxID=38727 RepID=A0A8T0T8W8_PANVG|nr:hypothetical protein PVAP13_4NG092800 [Panicum virgatum]
MARQNRNSTDNLSLGRQGLFHPAQIRPPPLPHSAAPPPLLKRPASSSLRLPCNPNPFLTTSMLRRQRRSRIHGARVLASRLIRPQRDPARASPLRMGSCECATSYGPNPQPWTSRRTASRRSSSPTAPAPGSLCPTLSPEIST